MEAREDKIKDKIPKKNYKMFIILIFYYNQIRALYRFTCVYIDNMTPCKNDKVK